MIRNSSIKYTLNIFCNIYLRTYIHKFANERIFGNRVHVKSVMSNSVS